MTGKIRIVFVAMVVAAGLVAAAPAVLADSDISFAAYECRDLGTETVRVDADGTIHIRGQILLGESESTDPRFDGLFRRRSNLDIYPDGSGVVWGVHDQRSHTYQGAWKIGFMVPFDASGFNGRGSGLGSHDFAGLGVTGTISGPLLDTTGSPCNPVLAASTFTGTVSD